MSTSTTSLPQLDLAAADQPGDVVSEQQQQQQQEQSMDFSKPPLKKTGSASSASPTEDESHSTYHDSFLVDELAVVGSGATVTYTGDSSFASFDEQVRAAREREARRRQAAEHAGAVLSPGSGVSVRERQKLLWGKSMPHLQTGVTPGGDEGEERRVPNLCRLEPTVAANFCHEERIPETLLPLRSLMKMNLYMTN